MTDNTDTSIDNLITALEARRRHYLQIYVMAVPMGFAVSCAIAASQIGEGQDFPWPIIFFVTFAIAVIGFQLVNTLYRGKTKNAFLSGIAESLGLTYHRRGVFNLDDIMPHQILPVFDRAHVEDGFSGEINAVPVAFQELKLTKIIPASGRDDQDREEIAFWGLCLKIRIGKILDAHTVVYPRNRFENFYRTLFSKYQKINLVTPRFESRFSTVSTDQVEARYVLDPAFIECFLDAADIAGTKFIQASFKGQDMILAANHDKPLFEIGHLFRALTPESLAAVRGEIESIEALVRALKLNPYTGLGAVLPGKRD